MPECMICYSSQTKSYSCDINTCKYNLCNSCYLSWNNKYCIICRHNANTLRQPPPPPESEISDNIGFEIDEPNPLVFFICSLGCLFVSFFILIFAFIFHKRLTR